MQGNIVTKCQFIVRDINPSLSFHDERFQKVQFIGSSFSHLDRWSAYLRCCDYQRDYLPPPSFLPFPPVAMQDDKTINFEPCDMIE